MDTRQHLEQLNTKVSTSSYPYLKYMFNIVDSSKSIPLIFILNNV